MTLLRGESPTVRRGEGMQFDLVDRVLENIDVSVQGDGNHITVLLNIVAENVLGQKRCFVRRVPFLKRKVEGETRYLPDNWVSQR